MTEPHDPTRRTGYTRAAPLLLVLFTLPLMVGVRKCEKVDVGDLKCQDGDCETETCEYGGETHQVLDNFLSDDGCNTCTCEEGGVVACTEEVCLSRPCEYAGQTFEQGDSFPSDDGCNTCSCGKDGLVACTERACLDECGGIRGLTCPDGQICQYPTSVTCSSADFTGSCIPEPDGCDDIYQPVCGCDGQTYDNRCSALLAQVIVDRAGECELEPGAVCGTRGAAACADDEYCRFPASASCGAADAPGECTPRPDACDAVYEPVCGCDGMTYGNTCEAAAAGSSVAASGECDPTGGCSYNGMRYRSGETFDSTDGCNTCSCGDDGLVACTERACVDFCGGIAGFGCPAGQYCNYPREASCGVADQAGSCEPIPDACTADYVPVCGCDGMTYGNACNAAAAGVSIASEGECKAAGCTYDGTRYAPGDTFKSTDGCNDCTCSDGGLVACTLRACDRTCGGLAGIACAKGEFCDIPISGRCGAADATGLCRVIPDACIDVWDPVCGCDGVTYGNSCEAAAAGYSVQATGACASGA